jgi:hypothetical protein
LTAENCVAVGTFVKENSEPVPGQDEPVHLLVLKWNGTNWSEQLTEDDPNVMTRVPEAVSCAGISSQYRCSTVGVSDRFGTARRPFAYGYEGGTESKNEWTATDSDGIDAQVRGVSCVSASACVAIGDGVDPATSFDVGWHLDGSGKWDADPMPGELSNPALADISCYASNACTAVGRQGNHPTPGFTALAERWDGEAWKVQTIPNPTGDEVDLQGVSCAAETSCVAVGSYRDSSGDTRPLVESWNGSSWSIQTAPRPGTDSYAVLTDVSCVSASACIASGTYTDGGLTNGFVERWNGTAWTIETIPFPAGSVYGELSSVSCSSSTTCTVVGAYATDATPRSSFAARINGASWAIQPVPNVPNANYTVLTDVDCVSASECVTVGTSALLGQTGLTLRWDGVAWAIEPSASPYIGQLDAVSCWSVGNCIATGFRHEDSEPLAISSKEVEVPTVEVTLEP